MILARDAVVAVADGQRLRLFANKGIEPQIRLVALETPEIARKNKGSGARHRSVPANPDAARLNEDNFAAAAADYLSRQVLAGDFAQLYLIADPRTLGEMRRNLHEAAKLKLVGELAKDLTGHTVEEIEAALART